jgi:hypothetical protein
LKSILLIIICLGLNENLSSQVNYISISGNVISADNNDPVNNAIIILKLSSGSILQEKTDSLGRYLFKLKNDITSEFTIEVATDKSTNSKQNKKCGFLANREKEIGNFLYKTDFVKNFKLTDARHCEPPSPKFLFYKNSILSCNDSIYRVDSIYNFKFDDACNSLYITLKENPTVAIELQGHASAQEKNPDELALYRAQLIKEILVAKGINRKRIETKGWGNHKRLVKDEVIKKAKTKEEKNALHTKNQRVVFKVLNWDFEN